MNSVRSNNVSLKYQRFAPSGFKDIDIILLSLWQRLNSFKKFEKNSLQKSEFKIYFLKLVLNRFKCCLIC